MTASGIRAEEVKGFRLFLASLWIAIIASFRRLMGRSQPSGSNTDDGGSR